MEPNELRKIAESATPGPWTLEYDNSDDWEAGINDGDYPYTIHGPRNCSFDNWTDKSKIQDYLNRVTEISEMVDEDAEFIATFDPPTVLALLSRLEQAERVCDKLMNRLDAMRRQRDGYRNQLRKTEQQIQRVRELCRISEEHAQEYGDTASVYVDDLKHALRALDGDTRG